MKIIINGIKNKESDRFYTVYSQGMGSTKILVDKETGVNYVFHATGYAGGLTVLLDAEGRPVVTPMGAASGGEGTV